MNTCKLTCLALALGALVAVGLVVIPDAVEGQPKAAAPEPAATKLPTVSPVDLQAAINAIDAAKQAVEAGDKKTALAELGKARKLVADVHYRIAAACPRRRFVNARCPMMGTAIDPAKVPQGLTRPYKGRRVAFCCAGCPAAWDKLTDEQKEDKLGKAQGQ